jgi:hypothetical protein
MSDTPQGWRDRIVGLERVAPDQLLANPANWRTHPGMQRDALRGALSDVGWVDAIMVNVTTGHVVDGHARIEEALTNGEPTVPVLYVELTENEERLVLATFDPIGAMAETDGERLQQLLDETRLSDDSDLASLLEQLAQSSQAYVPEPSEQSEPTLDGEHLVELHVSAEQLERIRPTLKEWADEGAVVNIA